MGYTTDFNGQFKINQPLDDDTYNLLVGLNNTRRMKRNVSQTYGIEGEFYVEGSGDFGQGREDNIIEYNTPPKTQPGLWCNWVPTEDRNYIEWDGGEKFYNYIEWIEYLIEKILAPKNYILNGEVRWSGEDPSDNGVIIINNNTVKTKDNQYYG